MVIGLLGLSCSGKDEVAKILSSSGYLIIDEDKLGHDALIDEKERIIDAFGSAVETDDGFVDRKALSKLCFSARENLEKLESISHPYMRRKTKEIIDSSSSDVVINAAILERLGLDEISDCFLFVTAPYEVRQERAFLRNGTSAEDFEKRTRSQENIGEKIFSSNKDVYVIENTGSKAELERKVLECIKEIEKRDKKE